MTDILVNRLARACAAAAADDFPNDFAAWIKYTHVQEKANMIDIMANEAATRKKSSNLLENEGKQYAPEGMSSGGDTEDIPNVTPIVMPQNKSDMRTPVFHLMLYRNRTLTNR